MQIRANRFRLTTPFAQCLLELERRSKKSCTWSRKIARREAAIRFPTAGRQFDYEFLCFESGRFGTQALARLADDANEDVRARAARMQQTKKRTFHASGEPDPAVTEPAFSHATVYPENARLPDDFRYTDFSKRAQFVSGCLRDGTPCDIYILPHGAPSDSAIIVRDHNLKSGSQAAYHLLSGQVFQRDREGKWANTGTFSAMECPSIVDALRAETLRD